MSELFSNNNNGEWETYTEKRGWLSKLKTKIDRRLYCIKILREFECFRIKDWFKIMLLGKDQSYVISRMAKVLENAFTTQEKRSSIYCSMDAFDDVKKETDAYHQKKIEEMLQ